MGMTDSTRETRSADRNSLLAVLLVAPFMPQADATIANIATPSLQADLGASGAALMFPQTLTGIQLSFDGPARVRAISLYAVALSVGAVAGQILGGVLISANLAGSHWRAIFLINVPIAAITVACARRYLPSDPSRGSRSVDVAGVAGLSVSCLLVVLPLVLGRVEGWPLWTWLCLAAAGPAIAGFVLAQRRVAARGGAPLVHVGVLARPAVGWALAALLVATATYYALLFTLAQYLQEGLGGSALVSGLTVVPWVAARSWPT